VRLLDRSQRTVTPTAAGKRLQEFATGTRRDYEALLQDLERLREDIAGELVIAASNIPGEYILPPLLAAFKRRHPAVTVQVNVMDSREVIDGVLSHAYEIGFCGMDPENKDLTAVPIAGDEIVLIVPPSHPFGGRGAINTGDLYGELFITREPSSGTRATVEQHLQATGIDIRKLSTHLILGSTQAVVSGVAAGAGIAFVSSLALGRQPSVKGVRRITVKGLEIQRTFFCIYHENRLGSRLLESFTAFITSGAAAAGD